MAPSLHKRDADRDAAQIPQFYAGREVLITGATGFIGKVLTERLLSTCPDIGHLHLLVRVKRDQSPESRFRKFKECPLFDVVRENNPGQLDKLSLIPGDIVEADLGLDETSIAALQNVSVVFHLAATVKFNEKLELAVTMNTLSVMRLLDVCDRLPNMATFVYVSTAYCHAERRRIEELVYPLPRPLDQMIEDSLGGGRMTPDELERFLSPKPNTYTFTKAMAESAVKLHGNRGYPIAICRPTIVTSSLRDPFPGWVQGLSGPIGMIAGIARGLMRVIVAEKHLRPDLLPVDIAANTIIAVAWETAMDNLQDVRVYNCSTMENPTTCGEMHQYVLEEIRTNPSARLMWYPSTVFASNRYTVKILEFVLEIMPMYLADCLMKIFGKMVTSSRINLIAVSQRMVSMRQVLCPFTTREYGFSTDNVRRLRTRLTPSDAALYNTDPASISWKQYYKVFTRGVIIHIIKDKEAGTPAAKKRLIRLLYIHRAVMLFLLLVPAYLLRDVLLHSRILKNIQTFYTYLPKYK